MPNFNYRKLIGVYRAGVGDRFSDVNKIDNMFLEVAKDHTDFGNRLKALEAVPASGITTTDFIANTINGTIILEASLPGSKLTDGSITGAKLVLNSSEGITDANIAPNAGIQLSKLDLSTLSHGDLLNHGTLTHVQIEAELDSLASGTENVDGRLTSAETNIGTLQTQMGASTLNTTAQTVTAAINEVNAAVSGIVIPDTSGVVTITGTQTINHPIVATGVDDVLGVVTNLQYASETGVQQLKTSSSLGLLTAGASATSTGNENVILSAGATISINGTNIVAAIGDRIDLYASGVVDPVLSLASGSLTANGNLLPLTGSEDIGASGNPWNAIYAASLSVTNFYVDSLSTNEVVTSSVNTDAIEFPTNVSFVANADGTPKTIISTIGNGALSYLGKDSAYIEIGSSGTILSHLYGTSCLVDLSLPDGLTEYIDGFTPAARKGTAVIPSGLSGITIPTTAVAITSHVFATKRTSSYPNTDAVCPALASIVPGSGFVISTGDGSNVSSDYQFSWFILS